MRQHIETLNIAGLDVRNQVNEKVLGVCANATRKSAFVGGGLAAKCGLYQDTTVLKKRIPQKTACLHALRRYGIENDWFAIGSVRNPLDQILIPRAPGGDRRSARRGLLAWA